MKVIFTQEVTGVAHRDEVREVAEGYALNYLFPQGLAVRATPERLAALTQRSQAKQISSSRELEQAKSRAGELGGKVVTLACRASSAGKLYAAVTPDDAAQTMAEQLHLPLTASQIIINEHLKAIGDHQVTLKLHPQISVKITLRLTSTA
ncbi:MAG: 50S ribosomal protein L9 [Candidatus Kerfeldbacteria bacterium]|nr:50S ribosomal protein L9 [Candidatus Kerfeldbacteria bacterium]